MSREVKGLSFPLRFGPLGHFERSSGHTKLRENMETIIRTSIHSREMNEKFGSLGMEAVLRSADEATFTLIRDVVGTALSLHEPRVVVIGIESKEGAEEGQVVTTVSFRVKDSGEYDELTQILSAIPGEA